MLKLMYITNNLDVALVAQRYGVDRIWIDLETEGKEERQRGLDTVKSKHTISDIYKIKPFLTTSKMLVRINPWSERSPKEIDDVIKAGADIIMLPMWKSVSEVKKFINSVNGRCKTLLLLETIAAEMCLDEVLSLQGIDEIHIGLNDLHLEYKLPWMFLLLANGKVEEICSKIRKFGIPFGFGGIGLMGKGLKPSPEEIILEHFRLGSTGVILSRSFCNYEKIRDLSEIERIFSYGLNIVREQEKKALSMTADELNENKRLILEGVNFTINKMNNKEK